MRTQYHFLLLLLGTLQYKNNKRHQGSKRTSAFSKGLIKTKLVCFNGPLR